MVGEKKVQLIVLSTPMDVCSVSAQLYTSLNIITIDFPSFMSNHRINESDVFHFNPCMTRCWVALDTKCHSRVFFSFFPFWKEKYISIYVFNRWSNDANTSHCNAIKDIHNKWAFSTFRIQLLKAPINLTACFSPLISEYLRTSVFITIEKSTYLQFFFHASYATMLPLFASANSRFSSRMTERSGTLST